MQAISVINFKGGVGKTTLTANLGVELSRRGHKVLLIDLDPQSSLTFSFFTPAEYKERLRGVHTLKCWLDSFSQGRPTVDLRQFFVPTPKIGQLVGHSNGFVHVIPSDLELANLELEIVKSRGPRAIEPELEILYRRSALADALRRFPSAAYDFVLMDCPPSLGILTQSALVASDRVLIPTKADYLSHVGIESLINALDRLRLDYNGQLARRGLPGAISPRLLGVVFNMVSYNPQQRPIADHQYYINQVKAMVASTFSTMIRDSDRHFGRITPSSGPAILSSKVTDQVYVELMGLTTEFLSHFQQHAPRRAAAA
jgi:chromosome partitioning protein